MTKPRHNIQPCGYLIYNAHGENGSIESDLKAVDSLAQARRENQSRKINFENSVINNPALRSNSFDLLDDFVCQSGTFQKIADRSDLKGKYFILSDEVYKKQLSYLARIPICSEDSLKNLEEKGGVAVDQNPLQPYFLSKTGLQVLFNYGFRYQNYDRGLYEYLSQHDFCQSSGKNGEIEVFYTGSDNYELEEINEEANKFLDPKQLPIEIPDQYPVTYAELADIAAEELNTNESLNFADRDRILMDEEFMASHHIIELTLNEAILLRHIMSLYDGAEMRSEGRYKHLLPIEKMKEDQFSYRRKYAISTSALYYYGPNAINQLRMLANGDHGSVSAITKEACLTLAKKLEELRNNQQAQNTQKNRPPISLNLERLMPALKKVFPHVKDIEKELRLDQSRDAFVADAKARYTQSEHPRAEDMVDLYTPWHGLLFDVEIKLFFFIVQHSRMLSTPAFYTEDDIVGLDAKHSPWDFFICNVSSESEKGNSCLVRRHQAWEGVIGSLIAIRDNCSDPSQLVRLNEIIAEAQRIEQRILSFSGAEIVRKSIWSKFGGEIGALLVGILGTTLVAGAREYMKRRKENAAIDTVKEDPKNPNKKTPNDKIDSKNKGKKGPVNEESSQRYAVTYPESVSSRSTFQVLRDVGLIIAGTAFAEKILNSRIVSRAGGPALVGLELFFYSDSLNAQELQLAPDSQLEGNRFILDKNVCLHELAKNASDTPALGQETVKISTGYCGIDEVKTYLEERGEEETLKKLEEAQVWMSDQTEGVDNFARSLILAE